MPKWFKNQGWYDTINYSATSSFDYSSKMYFIELEMGNFNVRISSLELAVLEMLYLIPQQQSFDEALQLVEGLTTLKFDISHSSLVTLKVYDLLGNEVATLVNGNKKAGTYSIQFNTQQTTNNRQLSSGIYFYTIHAGNFILMKK